MCTAATAIDRRAPGISARPVRPGVAREGAGLQGPARHPQLRHQRSDQAQPAAGIQHRRKRQRHAPQFLRWRKIRLPRLRLGRNAAARKSPAPIQQRPDDRGYVRSGERAGSFPLVGSRTESWARKKNTRNIASPEITPRGPGNHGAITVPKRVEDGGTVGYGGFGAFGFYVMDLIRHQTSQALRPHAVRIRYLRHNSLPHLLSGDCRRRASAPDEQSWWRCTNRWRPIAARITTLRTCWT